MSKTVILVRERPSEQAAYVNVFRVATAVTDPEAAMRAAVADFLATPEGMQAIRDSAYDFNWGDAVTEVPDEFWQRHGLRLLSTPRRVVRVDQDEILIPDR